MVRCAGAFFRKRPLRSLYWDACLKCRTWRSRRTIARTSTGRRHDSLHGLPPHQQQVIYGRWNSGSRRLPDRDLLLLSHGVQRPSATIGIPIQQIRIVRPARIRGVPRSRATREVAQQVRQARRLTEGFREPRAIIFAFTVASAAGDTDHISGVIGERQGLFGDFFRHTVRITRPVRSDRPVYARLATDLRQKDRPPCSAAAAFVRDLARDAAKCLIRPRGNGAPVRPAGSGHG